MAALKGLIIGAGFFSRIQMADWRRMPELVEMGAVCDADAARGEAFAREFGIPRVYQDAAAALEAEKPDFVDIVTRPEAHGPLVELAAERGVPVLCQKPFAPTLAECERMVAKCAEKGVRLMVNENWRWQAWYREMARRLAAGEIGAVKNVVWVHSNSDGIQEPLYPNQPYFAEYPRFLIYETLVHYLDCARFLFGEPKRLRAVTKRVNPKIAGEDEANIRLEYANGPRVWITGTRCGSVLEDGAAMGRMRVDGERDSLVMMGDGSLWRGTGRLERLPFTPPAGGYRGDSCYATQRHFAECLRTGAAFESSGEDYLKTVRLMEAAYASAAAREWVEFGS